MANERRHADSWDMNGAASFSKRFGYMDKGFDYDGPRAPAAAFGFASHPRTRGEEVEAERHAFPIEDFVLQERCDQRVELLARRRTLPRPPKLRGDRGNPIARDDNG